MPRVEVRDLDSRLTNSRCPSIERSRLDSLRIASIRLMSLFGLLRGSIQDPGTRQPSPSRGTIGAWRSLMCRVAETLAAVLLLRPSGLDSSIARQRARTTTTEPVQWSNGPTPHEEPEKRSPNVEHDLRSLPPLRGDLLLAHPPAVFDFRERRDIYFPFLGTSGDVPITPLYEYFPLGFKTLQRHLSSRGFDVKLINLSTVLLRYPKLEFDTLIEALDVKLLGLDLHWMVHVQGSLAVAERVKNVRPDIPVVFGGISSTYYADQLIRYPFIDMVMKGYDTHEPMAELLNAIKQGREPAGVPNLLWKSAEGVVRENRFSHKPSTFGCGIDWSETPSEIVTDTFPIREFVSTQNAGCAFNCGWCGGSRDSFRRINECSHAIVRKQQAEVAYEVSTTSARPDSRGYHFYSVGSYNEPKRRMEHLIDQIGRSPLKSVSYEQFHLTDDCTLERMARANSRTTITLSPESHDQRVATLAGRGAYTNEELEQWIEKALGHGIHGIDIWYFVGMPEQDEASVLDTVEYCRKLLDRFKGTNVNPMICPMIPFLDPASNFFEEPDQHGYRVFYRTVEEHRRGMERASIINRINYETKWLSRSDLVHVGFRAVRSVMEAKGEAGMLPASSVRNYNSKIDDALEFVDVVHEVDSIANQDERARELERLGDEILGRNNMIFFSGVMNQAFPINRDIGARWFDEMGWEAEDLEAAQRP